MNGLYRNKRMTAETPNYIKEEMKGGNVRSGQQKTTWAVFTQQIIGPWETTTKVNNRNCERSLALYSKAG